MSKHITIAMATYNGERFLKEQLDSLVNQDYPSFDLVVSDDNSTDGTLEILKSYQDKLPMTILINNSTRGVNGNFENAIRNAKGELISICDQDDIWESNKLSSLADAIGDKMLVYSNSQLINADGNPIGKTLSKSKKYLFTDGKTPKNFYFYNSMFGHTTLFKRELLDKALPFPPATIVNYDGWLSIVASTDMGYLPKALTRFRMHDGNLTHKAEQPKERGSKKSKTNRKIDNYNKFTKVLEKLRFVQQRKVLDESEQKFLNSFILALETKLQNGFSWRFLYLMIRYNQELLHYKKPVSGFFKAFSYAFTPTQGTKS